MQIYHSGLDTFVISRFTRELPISNDNCRRWIVPERSAERTLCMPTAFDDMIL